MSESLLSPSTREALEAYRVHTDEPLSTGRTASLVKSALAATEPKPWGVALSATSFVLACIAGATGFSMISARDTTAPVVAEVRASPSAKWHWERTTFKLESGLARITPSGHRAVKVVTPELEAVVLNSAAMFEVIEEGTRITVELGEVTWRADTRSGRLTAGERLTISGPAPALTVAPRGLHLETCAADASYEECLSLAAQGSGLAAETALFELGVLAHERGELASSMDRFRAYGERFPLGAFGPEASIALMLELKQAGESAAATAEARSFLTRFPDEPRAVRVRRWADQIH